MAAWSSARFLAPLALTVSVIAVAVVVATSSVEAPSAPEPLRPPSTTSTTSPTRSRAKSYVVKPGDNLTLISERTGVEIETLERLNPDLDPQALHAGDRLKLAP
jgi:LysM repeat protein